MGVYTTSGKINTTTVSGLTLTGLYAADGGINVVLDDAVNKGVFHPCGAIRINTANGDTYYDASGAVYTNRLLGPGR